MREDTFDVAVVGAGAAGLAAAIEASSLGLSTALLTRSVPGGSARTMTRIESVPGFAVALSGEEFVARAVDRAARIGVAIEAHDEVTSLLPFRTTHILTRASGSVIAARAVIAATGAEWSLPAVDGIQALLGSGVYGAPSATRSISLHRRKVTIFGGLREAADAALSLGDEVESIRVIVRESAACLPSSVRAQLRQRPKIQLLAKTEIVCAAGIDRLESLLLRDVDSGRIQAIGADALFITTAAKPRTQWLPPELERDCEGFVQADGDSSATNVPLVFAAGTLRRGITFGADGIADALRAAREAHRLLRA